MVFFSIIPCVYDIELLYKLIGNIKTVLNDRNDIKEIVCLGFQKIGIENGSVGKTC